VKEEDKPAVGRATAAGVRSLPPANLSVRYYLVVQQVKYLQYSRHVSYI